MVGAAYYVGGLAVHLAVSSMNKGKSVEARACRLVTMPEWQGAGVGFRFLNEICALQERGDEFARLPGRKTTPRIRNCARRSAVTSAGAN
jgi:hypothetical protein